jgi:hypothetical protein
MIPILDGSQVSDVLNVAVTNAAWTAITLAAGTSCKKIVAKLRDNSAWRVSAILLGTTYLTVVDKLELNIAKTAGQVLFYAQSVAANGTLEVLLED